LKVEEVETREPCSVSRGRHVPGSWPQGCGLRPGVPAKPSRPHPRLQAWARASLEASYSPDTGHVLPRKLAVFGMGWLGLWVEVGPEGQGHQRDCQRTWICTAVN
jgi:hypothetical protein